MNIFPIMYNVENSTTAFFLTCDKKIVLLFADYTKAFGLIDRIIDKFRYKLWQKLQVEGIQGNILCIIKSPYRNITACIKQQGIMTDTFSILVSSKVKYCHLFILNVA